MMKQRPTVTIAILLVIFFAAINTTVRVGAQEPTPTPGPLVSTSLTALEQRVFQLEAAQTQTIDSLKSSDEYNRFLIQVTGGLIALLVAIQGFATFSQVRLGRERESRQARREEERDQMDRSGIDQVSKVLTVVQQTLTSRLDAEKQAREEAREARQELQSVLDRFGALEKFYQSFQMTIARERQSIEEIASRLAKENARHDFRGKTDELGDFAQRFDMFETQFEALEEEKLSFNPRVPYILGIAAHYANQPEKTKRYLTEVLSFQRPEKDETEIAYNRRVANAYYYLGLTESNFGNQQDAISSFEMANSRDLKGRDFLTRVVTAEAYVMTNDFEKAMKFIDEVEEGVNAIERTERHLHKYHLRLRSRAALIRTNMMILRRENHWREEAKQLLEEVLAADPDYYYATATLAQIYTSLDNQDSAQKAFAEAYGWIKDSGDLFMVTEVRSRILLLMVAGMSAKHGTLDETRAEEHLEEADRLRDRLPKIEPQVCTVFSLLSKRNENVETIHHHIELIRKGEVFIDLEG